MTPHLPPYASYKPFGVDWLVDVPAHWRGSRLRYLADITTGERDTIDREDSGKYPFFVRSQTVERINTWSFDEEAVLTAGDGHVGKIFHYIDGKFDFHQRVYKFSDFRNVTGKFFFHYIKAALLFELLKGTAKTTVESIRLPMLKDFPFVIPPFSEQRAIARYLDHVDRRIQRYIEAKEQLIALLQKARQAIIQRAVTRGLDPNVPLKPSGVEWLGDVPAHWEVRRAKFLYHEVNERSCTGAEELMSVSHKTGVTLRKKTVTMFRAETNVGYKLCRPGDIVINTMWAYMAALGVARQVGLVSPSYNVYRPIDAERMNPDYIDPLLRTETYRIEYLVRSTGITVSRLRLYPGSFLDIPLLYPPVEEQADIVAHVDRTTATIDAAIDTARRQVESMLEYRASLIAHVVTGKLDVRAAVNLLQEAPEQESPIR